MPSTAPAPTPVELSPRRRRALLGVVALALMMVVSAVSGLNVALPDLALATGATQTELTWIVDAYTVVFAGLLLSAGAVGDRFGRKGILLAGLALFGAAAGMAMTVDDPQTLIALRGVMGVGAAAVMPVTLSVITTSFPPEERGRAVGVWVGVAGGGAVLGLFASGILLELFDWSSFFGLNVALAVLALLGTLVVVPSSRDPHRPPLDPVGGVLSVLTVAGLVFGIIEGAERGWGDAWTLSSLAVGAVSLVGFVWWELRREHPLLDPRLFRLRGFGAGSLALTVQFFGSFGLFFVILQYLQFVTDLSPLQAALCLLPLPFVLIPVARNAPRVADRLGTNRVVALGLTLSATGMLVLTGLTTDLRYWHVALGLVVFAAGMGLAGTPSTTAIVSSLPQAKQGVASAVNDVSREVGSAVGIAVLGSTITAVYRSGVSGAVEGLPPEAAERAEASIAFVRLAADRLGPAGEQLLDTAEAAFVDAATTAFVVAAVVQLVAAALVLWLAPRKGQVRASELEDALAGS
ncbi:MFS transporter [Aquipuribacter sp. SD81]|uniref:MFS transporter n=1 Tax=Aquipuribacter sp. SD81 TaxID=3127703 RepID=UPI0030189A2C